MVVVTIFLARANSFVVDGIPAVWLMRLKETIVSLMGLDHHCGSDYRIV